MREDNTYSIGEAINIYRCLACNIEIYLEKQIVDYKGRTIALERFCPQQHECSLETTQGMQGLDSSGQANIQNDVYLQGGCH